MPSLIIYYTISTAIKSSLTFFAHRPEFLYLSQGCVTTRFHTFFATSMDLVIPNHTGQLANLVSFSFLA